MIKHFSVFLFAFVFLFMSCFLEESEPPPKFVLQNYSSQEIVKVQIWKTTEEYGKAVVEYFKRQTLWMLDPSNPEKLVAMSLAFAKVIEEEQKIIKSEPAITDTNKIAPDGSAEIKLDAKKEYFVRVNGDSEVKSFELWETDVTLTFTDSGWFKYGDI